MKYCYCSVEKIGFFKYLWLKLRGYDRVFSGQDGPQKLLVWLNRQ